MTHHMVIFSSLFLALPTFWELNFWYFIPPETSLMLVKLNNSLARLHIQPRLDKPDLWASEKELINLVEIPFSNLPSVPPSQASGLRNSTKKDANREKVPSMLTDVLLIPGSRSPLPCGTQRLPMMKENTWLLLLITLSINLLL